MALDGPPGRVHVTAGVNLGGGGAPRTDDAAAPINTDYDLLSSGDDGETATALTDTSSQDDIVRGNDGNYLGRVSEYTRLD